MRGLPYRRLAGFYFFYFAYLGAFAPFFSLYLKAVNLSAVEIGVLMSLPQLTRIVAPYLWGWLADRSTRRLRVVRLTGVAGSICFLGVFAGTGFALLFAVLSAMTFFWSAALPLIEATTLSHLGDETVRYGRIRVWGSVGFIAAVVAVGYLLDWFEVSLLPWIVLTMMLGMLAVCWQIPEAPAAPHAADRQPMRDILRRPEVMALIAGGALMAAAHGPYYTFYSIHLVNHGYSKAVTGWLWALGVICEIGIFVWMPHLYRAFTLRQILIASFALAVVRFVAIGWGADSALLLLLAQTLHAATFGSFHAAAVGVVHQVFRGRHQARGQAIYGSFSFGLGGTLGGIASGYAWEASGAGAAFTLGAACAALGVGILWRWLRLGGQEPRAGLRS
ncbi:MAG: MFS transporter [Betaproteobacteria bacterium RIFCSPLOWO2_12_FULL_62_13]|nr:MAG: MFS transporter [Betaproteobacteria bacterium RIFCSPLOWO2_12_FULL_62_13]